MVYMHVPTHANPYPPPPYTPPLIMNKFHRSTTATLVFPPTAGTCVIPIRAQEGVHASSLHYIIEYRPEYGLAWNRPKRWVMGVYK